MAIRLRFASAPEFLPDETVLHSKPFCRFISVKALPTYRLFLPLPPLWSTGLYITNRRFFLVVHLFGCVTQECSAWYPGKGPPTDPEVVHVIRVGVLRLLGPYLEVITYNPKRRCRWLCAPKMRWRFYVTDPDWLRETISQGVLGNRVLGDPSTATASPLHRGHSLAGR